MKAASVGIAFLAAGCGYSVDEMQNQPVRLSLTVPAAWDRVGTCITAAYASDFETTYLPVPSERRSEVLVKFTGPGIVQYKTAMYVFQIRGGDRTTVDWRAVTPNQAELRQARERIERCGNVPPA